jgi:hypothetical protein
MAARDSVNKARQIRLDAGRQENALRRVRTAISVAEHHEKAAAVERAKALSLIRTWNLCPQGEFGAGKGFCCGQPEGCQGRQP